MNRYILLSFGFMGWAFYEVSGGDEFEPRAGFANAEGVQVAEIQSEEPDDSALTRLSLLDNSALTDTADQPVSETDTALQAAVLAAIKTTDVEMAEPVVEDVRVKLTLPVEKPAAEETAKLEADDTLAEPEANALDLRAVARDRVNLREGPGKEFTVLGKLNRGTTVMVLEETGDGWVMLQVVPGGKTGWMADWLLTQDG